MRLLARNVRGASELADIARYKYTTLPQSGSFSDHSDVTSKSEPTIIQISPDSSVARRRPATTS